jgi:hypothetical protein
MKKPAKIYMYDPVNNTKVATDFDYLAELSGYTKNSLVTMKSKRRLVKTISCYIVDDTFGEEDLRELMTKYTPRNEIWRDTDESGKYQVSNYGRVRRVWPKAGPRFLMPYYRSHSKRIQWVKVSFKGKYGNVPVHKLVAELFLDNPNNYIYVIHKNGIQYDNRAENLKWVSNKEAARLGGKSSGTPVAMLDYDTLEIIEDYPSVRAAARDLGCHEMMIHQVLSGRRKTTMGYRWKAVESYF